MKFLFAALLLLPTFALAQSPAGGLTPDVKDEVLRRRAKMEELGSFQATPRAAAIQALKLPNDDSNKFHINFVVTNQAKYAAVCKRLEADLQKSDVLRAWVKVDDLANSYAIPNVRLFENATQQWWFKYLKEKLAPVGPDGKPIVPTDSDGAELPLFPAIVITPPLNGKLGSKNRVIGFCQGYNGPEELSELIGNTIDQWHEEQAKQGGHSQAAEPLYGVPPPFQVDPKPAAPGETQKVQVWPEHVRPAPKHLTARQIRLLIPDAPPEFRVKMAEEELTDPNDVKSRWLTEKMESFQRQQDERLKADEAKRKKAEEAQAESLKLQAESKRVVQTVSEPIDPRHAEPAEASDGGNFPATPPAPLDLLPMAIAALITAAIAFAIQKYRDKSKADKSGEQEAILAFQRYLNGTKSEKSNGPTANGIEPSA